MLAQQTPTGGFNLRPRKDLIGGMPQLKLVHVIWNWTLQFSLFGPTRAFTRIVDIISLKTNDEEMHIFMSEWQQAPNDRCDLTS